MCVCVRVSTYIHDDDSATSIWMFPSITHMCLIVGLHACMCWVRECVCGVAVNVAVSLCRVCACLPVCMCVCVRREPTHPSSAVLKDLHVCHIGWAKDVGERSGQKAGMLSSLVHIHVHKPFKHPH